MAPRRNPRKGQAQLAFEALSIEGGLLTPSFLAGVAQLQASGQSEADYRIPKGLNLRDEIGRYWRIAQAYFREFTAGRARNADARLLAQGFVLPLLRESFGFGTLGEVPPAEVSGRSYPIGFSALGGRVPVIVAPAGSGLDTLAPAFGDGGRRRSAFGLAQEYLNAADEALWGIASDGVTLRILRDNASMTRPAWIEADLGRIFAEERYADFAALWLLLHESRFGRPGQPPTECALEAWRNAGLEEGIAARNRLRAGVEQALLAMGQGFLSHPDNKALQAALHAGSLTTTAYFQQLLRLVYRLLFLLTAEERGVLHPPEASEAAKKLYASGYSLRRLRERSVKRSAHDRFSDLWEGVKIVFRGLASGEPHLGLPALAGLFAKDQCPALDAAKVENRALLAAMFRLSWLREEAGLSRVNWRDMGPEELGSVYESLLELVPQITEDGRTFSFATGGETKGNARKLTGSYYTPDSLVQVLLDSALEPVVQSTIAAHPENPAEALLQLAVVDPACGSGHFLLAAARRLASHVARLQANGTPSAPEYRQAVRQVVGRCIHGVDLNPMAVELCKVSLWMEAVEPGRPLSFLDSHIQHGNALLGATPELMAKGVPDAAWEPIEGDDKKIASALKKKNKKAAGGQRGLDLFSRTGESEAVTVARAVAELEKASDADAEALAEKEAKWRGILGSDAYRHQKFVADAWCAAFVWPKQAGDLADAAPTDDAWRQIRDGQMKPSPLMVKKTADLAEQYHFFHWHLAFPQVFERGGFDVVLGNPPWDQIQLDAREWFASRAPGIANAQHHAARTKALDKLRHLDPGLHAEFVAAQRRNEGTQAFIHASGRYPRASNGRLNTAPLFAETSLSMVAGRGFSALIVPTGIATDSFTREFFQYLVESQRLHHLLGFENEARLFPGVDHRVNFCLLIMGGLTQKATAVNLVSFARHVVNLREPERNIWLSPEDFHLFNPNSMTCPIFRSRRDARLNREIYHRTGVFVREGAPSGDPWGFRGLLMFMMNTDSVLFHTRAELEAHGDRLVGNRFEGPGRVHVPLYEAKMVYHFNHRFGDFALLEPGEREHILPQASDDKLARADYLTAPRYWVAEREIDARIGGSWPHGWFLGWRDVTDARSSVRTVVAAVVPRVAVGHKLPLLLLAAVPSTIAALYANLCSFILDYCARQKVGGTSLTFFIIKQLPILPPVTYAAETPWSRSTSLRDWLFPRVLELTYTAWDLRPFAQDVGYDGPPFRWDPARRFLLRAELDAAFFHLYGISRDDADYILETFPIVRKNDEKAHGEYRTKRVILEIYDALAEATRTGRPYQTRLDPAPADPRVAHPPDPSRTHRKEPAA